MRLEDIVKAMNGFFEANPLNVAIRLWSRWPRPMIRSSIA
jgi:hypothetical protein